MSKKIETIRTLNEFVKFLGELCDIYYNFSEKRFIEVEDASYQNEYHCQGLFEIKDIKIETIESDYSVDLQYLKK